jgi:hypothetical protein
MEMSQGKLLHSYFKQQKHHFFSLQEWRTEDSVLGVDASGRGANLGRG